jgi:hypothetical protein
MALRDVGAEAIVFKFVNYFEKICKIKNIV